MAKKIYPKNLVLNTAIEIAKEVGLEKLSIRGIAKKLNVSVSPVYDSFESKEDLIKEIIVAIFDQNAAKETYFLRNEHLLSYGLTYPILYRDMQKYTRVNKIETTHTEDVLSLMKREVEFEYFTNETLLSLNFDLLLYISGLVQFSEKEKGPTYSIQRYQEVLKTFTEIVIFGYQQKIKRNEL